MLRPDPRHVTVLVVLLVVAAALTGCTTEDEPDADAADPLPHFSFFVTSLESMRELSGSQDGFGGDLRFGETGPGAGLRGADKLCATIADKSMPGSSAKGWRAFLSATADEHGVQVDAIDRIGEGPWYDRVGRLWRPPPPICRPSAPRTAPRRSGTTSPTSSGCRTTSRTPPSRPRTTTTP